MLVCSPVIQSETCQDKTSVRKEDLDAMMRELRAREETASREKLRAFKAQRPRVCHATFINSNARDQACHMAVRRLDMLPWSFSDARPRVVWLINVNVVAGKEQDHGNTGSAQLGVHVQPAGSIRARQWWYDSHLRELIASVILVQQILHYPIFTGLAPSTCSRQETPMAKLAPSSWLLTSR